MRHFQENEIATHSIDSQPWESQQVDLYAQLQAFAIDHPCASLPFSKRLARDHQWSPTYTQRVIEEYKKFLFLAIVADHPVTPSNAVDRAWHLHLTYTHSYWNDLCTQILLRPLHHHPTQGGQQQQELFWDCYSKTLNSYERFFGDRAPVDIWPTPATRFRQVGQFRQVNSQDYWVIPKPSFARFQRVFWNISHPSWSRNVIIALLTIGLVFSLNFLYHWAIAASIDSIEVAIAQPAVAQVFSSPNSDVFASPEVKSAREDFRRMLGQIGHWFMLGLFSLLVICNSIDFWIDSRCPVCKRFWLMKKTTHVLREPTERRYGECLITRRCKCCDYTQKRRESIPPEKTDSYDGCGCV